MYVFVVRETFPGERSVAQVYPLESLRLRKIGGSDLPRYVSANRDTFDSRSSFQVKMERAVK